MKESECWKPQIKSHNVDAVDSKWETTSAKGRKKKGCEDVEDAQRVCMTDRWVIADGYEGCEVSRFGIEDAGSSCNS